MPRFVVVGNANCRRVALFQAALARLGLPPALLVLWADLLLKKAHLSDELRKAKNADDCLLRGSGFWVCARSSRLCATNCAGKVNPISCTIWASVW